MSGILDSKSRIIDTVITTEGRRQLSQGGIDIQYVTFTDGATFYRPDVASGSQDATKRLYLEACQLPQDDLTFQADDTGNLQAFGNASGINLTSGMILEYSFAPLTSSLIASPSQTVSSVSGARFSSMAQDVLGSSGDNLSQLYLIASEDKLFDDDGFALGPNSVTFTVNNNRPIQNTAQQVANVNSLDSVFSDPRFSNCPNFSYLPPLNRCSDTPLQVPKPVVHNFPRKFKLATHVIEPAKPSLNKARAVKVAPHLVIKAPLAIYTPVGPVPGFGLSYAQTMAELAYYDALGYRQTINFDPTSSANKLVGQFFEVGTNSLKKLDVIDFGTYPTGTPGSGAAHVFFVGKVVVDEKGTDTFIHIFTLVFE